MRSPPLTPAALTQIPGWFGKIPCLGDFASRRLPAAFISPWDAWLQSVIIGSREILDERWLEVYLHSPIWQFMLHPGLCGSSGWFGVLMPSVDRANRHFPLTIAFETPVADLNAEALPQIITRLCGLADIAADTLAAEQTLESLEGRLLQWSTSPPNRRPVALPTCTPVMPVTDDQIGLVSLSSLLGHLVRARRDCPSGAHDIPRGVWWSNATGHDGEWLMARSSGLPTSTLYAQLLVGEVLG